MSQQGWRGPRNAGDRFASSSVASRGGGGGGYTVIANETDAVDEGVNYLLTVGGDTFYVYYNGTNVLRADQALAIRYASSVTGIDASGNAEENFAVTDFGVIAFDGAGVPFRFRGFTFFNTIQSPTDASLYTWNRSGLGDAAILVDIETNNGTVFKNDAGSTTLEAVVYVGGVLQTATEIDAYTYRWTVGGADLCVLSGNNQVQDDNGSPQTATGGVCPTGQEIARTKIIVVGAEDVTTTAQFKVDVDNIAD